MHYFIICVLSNYQISVTLLHGETSMLKKNRIFELKLPYCIETPSDRKITYIIIIRMVLSSRS